MRTVSDVDGTHYLVVKQSSDATLVRDPKTGAERYIDTDRLDPLEGDSPLVTAASGIDVSVRRLLTATHNDQSLGLIVELVDRGPCSVIELLDSYDLCESDLHGLLAEFRAAGLVHEATNHGQRGYDGTELAATAISRLRGESGDDS